LLAEVNCLWVWDNVTLPRTKLLTISYQQR
jgi:hypothetical protein